MKQRLVSFVKSNKRIAAALVAAIVIAVIFLASLIVRRLATQNSLQTLNEAAVRTEERFREHRNKLSEKQKNQLRNDLKELLENWINKSKDDTSFKELDEIKKILGECPDDYVSLTERDDIYSIVLGSAFAGIERFDEFVADCRLGRPSHLIMAQITTNLDPIYYYLEYDGKTYHVVEDKTLDDYEGDNGYSEFFSSKIKFENYSNSEGGLIEYGFLTDDFNLNYKDVVKYYDQMEKSADSDLKEPNFWQFYVCLVNKDELENRVLPSDRLTEEFVKEYTGFADKHPYFKDENPIEDYDGDEILDRVYREQEVIDETRSLTNVYLFLGNGNTVTLGKNLWGDFFKTEMIDVTGDDNKDILFVQYNKGVHPQYGLSVFEYRNGNYVAAKLSQEKVSEYKVKKSRSGSIIECASLPDAEGNTEEYTYIYENGIWNKY